MLIKTSQIVKPSVWSTDMIQKLLVYLALLTTIEHQHRSKRTFLFLRPLFQR